MILQIEKSPGKKPLANLSKRCPCSGGIAYLKIINVCNKITYNKIKKKATMILDFLHECCLY